MWTGIEQANSMVFNPHKWMGTAFDCSAYFVKDPEHLVRVLSTNPSYLHSTGIGSEESPTQFRDWGVPLGRRFRALKLWFQLRLEGVLAIQERLRRDMAYARDLEARVRAADHWRVVAPVVLQTVCVRHEPPHLDPEAVDAHTKTWVERINASGEAWLTPAQVDGRWMVRVSFGSARTQPSDVDRIWDLMKSAVS
jgi:aromatic-L-amino-acid decarboxylase